MSRLGIIDHAHFKGSRAMRLRPESQKSARALLAVLAAALTLASCGFLYDPATCLDAKVDAAAAQLDDTDGATLDIEYRPPDIGQNSSYAVQFDKVGALIVWYKNASGQVTDSGSTSHLARYVDIPKTYIVEKSADAVLTVELQRQHGRVVVTAVR